MCKSCLRLVTIRAGTVQQPPEELVDQSSDDQYVFDVCVYTYTHTVYWALRIYEQRRWLRALAFT